MGQPSVLPRRKEHLDESQGWQCGSPADTDARWHPHWLERSHQCLSLRSAQFSIRSGVHLTGPEHIRIWLDPAEKKGIDSRGTCTTRIHSAVIYTPWNSYVHVHAIDLVFYRQTSQALSLTMRRDDILHKQAVIKPEDEFKLV